VRRAFLLGEAPPNRIERIDDRRQEFAEIFGLAASGFSFLDNHLHVLVRLDLKVANDWSDLGVVRRGGPLFPPRDR
jgi:hypothetical protein